jgi:hypothetical protein
MLLHVNDPEARLVSTYHGHKRSTNQRRERPTTCLSWSTSHGLSLSLSHVAAHSISFSCLPLHPLLPPSLCGNEAGGHEGLPLSSLAASRSSKGQLNSMVVARSNEGQRRRHRWGSYSLSIFFYLSPHYSLSPFADVVLAGAAWTTAAMADGTLGTGTSEDDCDDEQADAGGRAAFVTSTGADTDRGKDSLDGGSRSWSSF